MRETAQALANVAAAQTLVDGLVTAGVNHAVISPGSRSSPLVLACDAAAGLVTWVIPDERAAAFFALGLAKADQMPVMLIATSGSAPANWYPAVIEAAQDLQPLILISADRPPDLQDCGANQTIDQAGLFGSHVRGFYALPEAGSPSASRRYFTSLASRSVDKSRWPLPGPVHLNVPFREPLIDAPPPPKAQDALSPPAGTAMSYPRIQPLPDEIATLATQLSGKPGLIVCGRGTFPPGFTQAITRLAEYLACPLLADPLSGLRYGAHERSHILSRYDSFLRRAHFSQAHQPEWVLRFGAMPVSQQLQNYLAGLNTDRQLVVAPFNPWPDPDHVANRVIHSDPEAFCQALLDAGLEPGSPRWHAGFVAEERRVAALEAKRELPLEAQVLHALVECCDADTRLFAGNSLVIRDVDSFLSGGQKPVTLTGNRGASGIEGNISTTLGITAACSAPVVGLLGDLALYHDMNGLLAARSLKATLVVFNNGGGGIFAYLAQARLPQFERYWLTPTSLDIGQIARLYDLGYHSVSSAGDFRQAFRQALDSNRTDLIEVLVDRQQSVALHKAYWEAVITQS